MIARIVKSKDGKIYLLNHDGTISNASISLLKKVFTQFDTFKDFSGSDGKWSAVCLDMSLFPGETLAFVTDDNQLVIMNPWIMNYYFTEATPHGAGEQLLTIQEYAKKHNRSIPMIKALCQNSRIIGARKVGRQWLIPESSPYPVEEQSQKPNAGRTSSSN